jgi:hypothetical protein
VGITACIGHKDLGKFAEYLVEGCSYVIKKFQVSRQARKYNPVPNPQTIYFTPWTVIEKLPTELATQLPLYVFNFVDFEELARKWKNRLGLVGMHCPCLAYSGSLSYFPRFTYQVTWCLDFQQMLSDSLQSYIPWCDLAA